MTITYAVTVKDELEEITRLLNFLPRNVREEDEILIQYDEGGATKEVTDFLRIFEKMHNNVKIIGFALDDDFGKFKSNLSKEASGDFLFQIDADEMPHLYLVQQLPAILEQNDVDLYFVPRINIVKNITQQHIDKWGWKVERKQEHQTIREDLDKDSEAYKFLKENKFIIKERESGISIYQPIINFPDFQTRIYRNTEDVKWIGKVHESITGYSTFTSLPVDGNFYLYHKKEIERQEKQNQYYETL